MGTFPGNKIPYDRCSLDSLSFSGLLTDQDQQPNSSNSNPNYSKPISSNKQSPEFEFVSTKTNSNGKPNTVKSTPADLLMSNGQLQPQALLIQENQPLVTNPLNSMGSLLVIDRSSSSSKRSSNEEIDSIRKKYEERFHKETNKKSRTAAAGRGRKLLKCFVSPCRECRATEPEAVKEHTVTRQNGKLH